MELCEKLRAEVMRTTKYRTKGLMENLEQKTKYTGERQREQNTLQLYSKNNNTLYMRCTLSELKELFYTSPDTWAYTSTISTRVLINKPDTNS